MASAAPGDLSDHEVVTIIRYPNRRLYDKSQGKYITLQDIEETVRHGHTVVVRDSKTGADLTSSLLTQIILERHPERMALFPVNFLHLIIRANEVMLGVLRDPMRQALQYAEMLQRTSPFNPLALSQEWLRTFLPAGPGQNPPEAPAPRGPDTVVDQLLRRIAELERRLDALPPAEGSEPDTTARKNSPGRKR
jgi:polyhydroxyalkanoate synthesis repressor PhaR